MLVDGGIRWWKQDMGRKTRWRGELISIERSPSAGLLSRLSLSTDLDGLSMGTDDFDGNQAGYTKAAATASDLPLTAEQKLS